MLFANCIKCGKHSRHEIGLLKLMLLPEYVPQNTF